MNMSINILRHYYKDTGNDNISARSLKKAGVAITDPIPHIINLSLKTGMFPKSWKKARVNPIYKGTGEKTNPGYYRPIAILPVLVNVKYLTSLIIILRENCTAANQDLDRVTVLRHLY